ncbi:MAG: UDP-N-acetylglucosamine 2-epimerase, partial [Actinomycetota bacterium]|nr:UDP-N-acetylglucosamine 2-epimerase [Actinomycetota bacterium]
VMLDTARLFAENSDVSEVLSRFELAGDGFYLATVHRAATSDDAGALASVIAAFGSLDRPVVWPVHPRTHKNLKTFGLDRAVLDAPNVRVIDPLGYGDAIALLRSAAGLLTDSGGMQKEAYFFGVPCVTLREETEWTETVEMGWNVLVGTDRSRISEAVATMSRPALRPELYGDGYAAEAVVKILEGRFGGAPITGR